MERETLTGKIIIVKSKNVMYHLDLPEVEFRILFQFFVTHLLAIPVLSINGNFL